MKSEIMEMWRVGPVVDINPSKMFNTLGIPVLEVVLDIQFNL